MNNNTIEIINILIKKVLGNKKPVFNENDIIQELLNMGYKIDDIDQAMELIFNEQLTIEFGKDKIACYNRIFTISEKTYIPIELQGVIRRLLYLNVLSSGESETLIARTVQNSYSGISKTDDIWELLKDIINDESKLEIISQKIPEFNNSYGKEFKYIN